MDESIGSRIRDLRKARNLTQADFVGPGVSNGYLSLIEKGLRNPSQKALQRIANILGISVSELVSPHVLTLSTGERAAIDLLWTLFELGDFNQFEKLVAELSPNARNSLSFQILEIKADAEKGNLYSAYSKLEGLANQDLTFQAPSDVWEFVNTLSSISTAVGNQAEAVLTLRQILKATDRHKFSALYSLICCVLASKYSEIGDHSSALRQLFDARNGEQNPDSDYVEARLLWAEAATNFNKGQYIQAIKLADRARFMVAEENDKAALNRIDNLRINCIIYSQDVSELEVVKALEIVNARLDVVASVPTKIAQRVFLETAKSELLAKLGRAEEALSIVRRLIIEDLIPPVDLPLLHLLSCELQLLSKARFFDRSSLETSINAIKQLTKTPNLLNICGRQIKLALHFNEVGLAQTAFEWYSSDNDSSIFFTNAHLK